MKFNYFALVAATAARRHPEVFGETYIQFVPDFNTSESFAEIFKDSAIDDAYEQEKEQAIYEQSHYSNMHPIYKVPEF